ncbi:MAG: OmpA family protein [Bacteroidia bacterium]|nr:OmpA family protein [Bacteroidia bacterium]
MSPGYYVVVGAYSELKEDAAQSYVSTLKDKGHDAQYGFNSAKRLYFVYLRFHTDLRTSIRDMLATRSRGEFTDAWVRVVPGDIVMPEAATAPAPSTVVPSTQTAQEPAGQNAADARTATPADADVQAKPDAPLVDDKIFEQPPIVQYNPMTLGNTEVFLSLFNATNNRIIDGEISVVDAEHNRLMKMVKGNEYMLLPDPKNNTGKVTLIAEVFGYRKIQHEFNYKTPLPDTIQPYVDLLGTTFVLYFDMVRYRAGDIATLYNVYFYNDAAIMLPESKYELDNLLALLKENPNYRIRLHGHTNGNYHGKIVSMGPGKNFFALTDDSRQSIGSAKELSEQRSEIIRDYLLENGIEAGRVEIRAWGGKRPIYDKNSANAKRNVRVEVEILQD